MGYVGWKEISKQKFREQLELSTGTMTKLNKGEEVSMNTLLRICEYFDCNFGDICDAVKIEETEKKQEEVSWENLFAHGICARYLLENVWNGI